MLRVAGIYEGVTFGRGGVSQEAILVIEAPDGRTYSVPLNEKDAAGVLALVGPPSVGSLPAAPTEDRPLGDEDVFGPDPVLTGAWSGLGDDDDIGGEG